MRKLINPQKTDIPELKKLWCECFPEDADGYCEFFFEHHFKTDSCLVVHNGQEIETAAYLFDAYYKGKSREKYGFIYLYAIGTLPKYRGKNNLEFIVNGSLEYAKNKGLAGIVVVAAEEIIFLYDRIGCKRIGEINVYSVEAKPGGNDICWEICLPEKFFELRRNYLDAMGNAFYWQGESEKYMYDDVFTKGDVLFCEFNGNEYFAVCTDENDRYIICETSFPLSEATVLGGSIASYYNYSGILDIYSRYDEFKYLGKFSCNRMYYGHYALCETFEGAEGLKDAYLNLIAD